MLAGEAGVEVDDEAEVEVAPPNREVGTRAWPSIGGETLPNIHGNAWGGGPSHHPPQHPVWK